MQIRLICGGALRLDGGAMFGIIPKALWSRNTAADEQNRIQLACNCLLVEWDGPGARRAVIETGHGAKYEAKEQSMFAIDPNHWLGSSLRELDVDPASISDVVLTHLHFDHAGGLTQPDPGDGAHDSTRVVPTFPNAYVHVQRQEFEDARANFGIMNATYREENFRPVDQQNGWVLHDGDVELLPQIRAWRTPGHTRGHQSIVIQGRDRLAIFAGDVIPTRHHVGAPYNMGYDLLPLDNRQSKSQVLRRLAERDGLLIIDHDPVAPLQRVALDRKWFTLQSAL